MVPVRLCQGATAPLDFRLKSGASPADLSNVDTVELVLEDRSGNAVATAGDVAVLGDATLGQVRYLPDAADLVVGTYLARFVVTDVAGLRYPWPGQDEPMVWIVGPVTR